MKTFLRPLIAGSAFLLLPFPAGAQEPTAPPAKPAETPRKQAAARKNAAALPPATLEAVSYGPDAASVLDFWKARGSAPAPLLVFIHGGGFKAGSRKAVKAGFLEKALAEGFANVSVDYPFLPAKPVQEILPSIARSVQYARHRAAEWNIDPQRIGVLGGSAGAGSSLWIAAHPDLADPASTDPVARESTRVQAAASINGQATYDLLKWEELVGPPPAAVLRSEDEPLAFYHLPAGSDLRSEQAKAIRAKVDVHGLIDAKTPPLFLFTAGTLPAGGPANRGAYVHSPRHSEAIAAKATRENVANELVIGEAARGKDGVLEALGFFRKRLGPVAPATSPGS